MPTIRDEGAVQDSTASRRERTDGQRFEGIVVDLAEAALRGDPFLALKSVRRLASACEDGMPTLAAKLRSIPGPAAPSSTRLAPTLPYASLPPSSLPLGAGPEADFRSGMDVPVPQAATLYEPQGSAIEPILSGAIRTKIDEFLAEHDRADLLLAAGLAPRRTVLLTGPPGVGKTTLARWLACRLSLPVLEVSVASVVSSLLGRTAQNLREAFEYARQVECVLLLDEFDALAKHRHDTHDVGEMKRAVSALLLELDRPPRHGLVVAATNHLQMVDSAFVRRFEICLDVPHPDPSAALAILEAYLGEAPPPKLRALVGDLVVGLSGAALKSLALDARRRATLHDDELSTALVREVAGRARSTESRRALARHLRAAAYSMSEIAEVLGISKSTVHSYLQRRR